jgi:hypothetical protein
MDGRESEPLDCGLLHAHRPNAGTCISRSESGACALNDVLLHLRPFLPNLRSSLRCLVRMVHRYYGTVRLLQHVHVRRSVYGLRGPAFANCRRRAGDLPVLVHVVSQRARALRLRRSGQPLAFDATAVLPSSNSEGSRHPDLPAFRSSIARPTVASVLRFATHLTACRARLEVRMESLTPFPLGSCIPYNMPVWPGAHGRARRSSSFRLGVNSAI